MDLAYFDVLVGPLAPSSYQVNAVFPPRITLAGMPGISTAASSYV